MKDGKKAAVGLGAALVLGGIYFATRKAEVVPPEEPEEGMAALYGVVTDTEGGLLQGVTVLLTLPFEQLETTTADNGSYQFENLEPGEVRISFEKEGYEPKTAALTLEERLTNRLDASLVEIPSPPSPAEVEITFRRERACMEGHMEGDQWVCTRYSGMEREGYITVVNQGDPEQLEVEVQGYTHWAADWDEFEKCQLHGEISGTSRNWADYFDSGQGRTYSISYMVPITGMPLDSQFFVRVFDPEGNIIAEKVFTTPL